MNSYTIYLVPFVALLSALVYRFMPGGTPSPIDRTRELARLAAFAAFLVWMFYVIGLHVKVTTP